MTDSPPKRLVLGLTGGVAAYKAAELARLLVGEGIQVHAAMTEAACRFITPVTLQALTGNPVYTDLWDPRIPNSMAHINLSREAGAILVAPASADFLAKLAQGRADDLLSTLCLARDCPLLVAPSMNRQMWENPATRRNVAQLEADGIMVLGPAAGEQACGETGPGRMLEPQELLEAVLGTFQPRTLERVRVMVTAGPTFEAIDPVRGLTNLSSGKMGFAIARAAREAGASVTLVAGPTMLAAPWGVERQDVVSASDMMDAVLERIQRCDIFVSVAAVADYRPVDPQASKIKRGDGEMTLVLAPNPDILATVAGLPGGPFCVGFAAESDNLRENAQKKRRAKRVAVLAANLAQHAIGSDDNELIVFDDAGSHSIPRGPKLEVARALMRHVADLYHARRRERGSADQPAPAR